MSAPAPTSYRVTLWVKNAQGVAVEGRSHLYRSRAEALARRRQLAALVAYNAGCGLWGRVTMRQVRP